MTGSAVIPALRVTDLRAGYGRASDILCGLDVDVAPETILAVIGPNGSGKSTFVKTLAGLLKPRAGSIAVTGSDVTATSPAKRVGLGLAYVPQLANVFAGMTVRENLQLARDFVKHRAGTGPEHMRQVMSLFPELATRDRSLAGNLSGGQRQMLAIASALLANPEVLLLDEPSAGLSPKFVAETMSAIARVRASGVTIVLVEQNVGAALKIADDVMVLVSGRARLRAKAGDVDVADLATLFFDRVTAP